MRKAAQTGRFSAFCGGLAKAVNKVCRTFAKRAVLALQRDVMEEFENGFTKPFVRVCKM